MFIAVRAGESPHMEDARTELELLRAREQAMTRFVALVAHELRAPATAVHGVAATLAGRPDELAGERAAMLVELLFVQSSRLVHLLEQLLDLSRLDAEAARIEPRRVPVRRRIVEVVELVAGERVSDVEIEVDGALEAELDPVAFDRILANLVTNALRHGAAPVRVAAELTDSHVRIVVEDRGAGVEPELAGRLFERFVGSPGDGTGLGLAIAQSYAHAHGGRILYEDAAPGARFRLVIPSQPPA